LAQWFGLSTFDFALISIVEADNLPLHNGEKAAVGPAFITRAESGERWSGDAKQLKQLCNTRDISRLVVFDTWTLNCDRHSWPAKRALGRARINRDNVYLSEEAPEGELTLKAMDHTHCFTCGRELSRSLRNIDNIKDPRVFGLFPEFRECLNRKQVQRAAVRLTKLDRVTAARIVESIPKEWNVRRDAREALVELIHGRSRYVAETIERSIWPQRDFNFDN
jgi:hypothetical protein